MRDSKCVLLLALQHLTTWPFEGKHNAMSLKTSMPVQATLAEYTKLSHSAKHQLKNCAAQFQGPAPPNPGCAAMRTSF